jgi:hypothetical protein
VAALSLLRLCIVPAIVGPEDLLDSKKKEISTTGARTMEARTDEKQTATAVEQMSTVLHDMCQPLTALQCRLQIAELMNSWEDYREAVGHGIADCARLAGHVETLRELLGRMSSAADGED